MDFKAEKKTVEGLLSSKKIFSIPRFQREYSWGTQELKTFYEDLINRIVTKDKTLDTSEYFIGSILLVGDMNDQRNKEIQVIDGQQRLTTITIFLSVIYKSFILAKEPDLANKIWEYIMGQDNNLTEYAILSNETPRPFFQYLIQKKEDKKVEPKNSEEENILKAYDYFLNQLKFPNIKKMFLKLSNLDISEYSYVDLLKVIRDQLLRCVVVCIWTPDIKYANMIFEILNAKGKTLASIDLIKNSIFEVLNKEQPADEAKEKWKNIRDNLNSGGFMIDFSTFFRHYWVGTQSKCVEKKLYPSFLNKIQRNEDSYLKFLDELVDYSAWYAKNLKLDLKTDFGNQKQYHSIIKSCDALNSLFGIVQVRPVLVNLYVLHKIKGIINFNQYKNFVEFLEIFHFCYNILCSKRTSRIEKTYSELSIQLYNVKTNNDFMETIQKYKRAFVSFMPEENEIITELQKIQYSKTKLPTNLIARYVLRQIEEFLCNCSVDENIYSVEHIIDESNDDQTLKLGNLLILETSINNSMGNGLDFKSKIEKYKLSKYKNVEQFLIDYEKSFSFTDISLRTEKIAQYFYKNIVQKKLKY